MELYNAIFKRKTIRKFKSDKMSTEELENVLKTIKKLKKLDENVNFDVRIVDEVKGQFAVTAPHYLIVSGNNQEHELENAGFLFEQLILWFYTQNLGCVWLGYAKDLNFNNKDIITIGFGYSNELISRDIEKFKRKEIKEITDDLTNECMEAVRLAPSGMNLQPWYFKKEENKIIVIKRNPNIVLSSLYTLTDLDIGIALCHYYLATNFFKKSWTFNFNNDKKKKNIIGEIII